MGKKELEITDKKCIACNTKLMLFAAFPDDYDPMNYITETLPPNFIEFCPTCQPDYLRFERPITIQESFIGFGVACKDFKDEFINTAFIQVVVLPVILVCIVLWMDYYYGWDILKSIIDFR